MKVNVQDAKTHFSKYLELVRQGQTVVVCNRNVPVAELRALPSGAAKRRIFGLHRGTVEGLAAAFPGMERRP
jgi:antitoxin (DNA-binding transcriptional repressor) of toxin-antitoxin stability system